MVPNAGLWTDYCRQVIRTIQGFRAGALEKAVPALGQIRRRDPRLSYVHNRESWSPTWSPYSPSPRGKLLSDATLSQLIKELGIAAVPHGFRSSFRDWAAERTNTPREVVEAALAHTVQNPTEAAYAPTDLFERRCRLMDDWSAYLCGTLGPVML